MSCENKILTYSISCCFLQVICNGSVLAEFNLPELRIIGSGNLFSIRDSFSSFDFRNYTINFTAEDLRTERCNCV